MQEGATSDFAMESAEIIPVTVNGLMDNCFWKRIGKNSKAQLHVLT